MRRRASRNLDIGSDFFFIRMTPQNGKRKNTAADKNTNWKTNPKNFDAQNYSEATRETAEKVRVFPDDKSTTDPTCSQTNTTASKSKSGPHAGPAAARATTDRQTDQKKCLGPQNCPNNKK